MRILKKEELSQLIFWSYENEKFNSETQFILSPDVSFILQQENSSTFRCNIKKITSIDPSKNYKNMIPTAKLMKLCPVSINHIPALDKQILFHFFQQLQDDFVVQKNTLIGIPFPKKAINESKIDQFSLLETEMKIHIFKTDYHLISPTNSSILIYFWVKHCEPALKTYSKINLKQTKIFVIDKKREGFHIPYLLEVYTSLEWSPSTSWFPETLIKIPFNSLEKQLYYHFQNLSYSPTLLLLGERRSGKRLLLARLARMLNVQLLEFNTFNLLGLNCKETCENFYHLFINAINSRPLLIHLRRLIAFIKERNFHNLHDCMQISNCMARLVNDLNHFNLNVAVVGSCCNLDEISSDLRSCFSLELNFPSLEKQDRFQITKERFRTCMIHKNSEQLTRYITNQTAGLERGQINEVVDNIFFHCFWAQCNGCSNCKILYNYQKDKKFLVCHKSCLQDIFSCNSKLNFSKIAKIPKVKWEDIGGLEFAKKEIKDTVMLPIQYPKYFQTQRTGILLFGPPGTGKTLLAKGIATECGLNFISVKGPELLNMYVGESERNVRDVFIRARNTKPCVLFFDEIDSIAPKRGQGSDGNGVIDRIVSQLLTELDGIDDTKDIFLIAATNRPDLLDPALMRPGRLDKQIYLGLPENKESKLKIMKALTRKFNLKSNIDLEALVQILPKGFSGADYYALCSDASMRAYKSRIKEIDNEVKFLNEKKPKNLCTPQSVMMNMKKKDLEITISLEDFLDSSQDLIPSLSKAEIQRYKNIKKTLEN